MKIENAHALAEAIQLHPAFVAQALQRIGRFGGTHPKSNVLVHSIDTAMRLRRQTHSLSVVTWGLLHDAHELLSGDHQRGWKSDSIESRQELIDRRIRSEIGLVLSLDEIELVEAADTESGNDEHHYWADVKYESIEADPVSQFTRLIHEWFDYVNQ